MIDCNVALGDWPFRAIFPRSAQQLTEVMARCGISKAWVSAMAGIFHKDLASVNRRLCEQVERYPQLTPVAVLNPRLPGWEGDLEQVRAAAMPGVRLYPNYHQYALADAPCRALLEAMPGGAFVQIVVRMEDERRQHPLGQVSATDLQFLPALAAAHPELSFVVCGANNKEIAEVVGHTPGPDNLWFEISHIEGVNGVASVISTTGPQKLVFGTHMPLFYPESSLLKLEESELTSDQVAAIRSENARVICGA